MNWNWKLIQRNVVVLKSLSHLKKVKTEENNSLQLLWSNLQKILGCSEILYEFWSSKIVIILVLLLLYSVLFSLLLMNEWFLLKMIVPKATFF